ncbi:MAG: phenylacetate--CoA ligase [Marinilabiliales bacterium]|nr:MAG: phenylacetate--CoA ligase [Marinilabiliales bacterium]
MYTQFFPEIEKKTKREIKLFQEELLRKQLEYTLSKSKYYKKQFADNSLGLSDINTIEDLQKVPVTTKQDLQQFNQDFICVNRNEIVDYITTSGTLGDPVTFAMTDKDLDRLAYNESISFVCAGGSSDDVYQLMTTIDKRFMAGLAYFLGVRKMGAGIIRVGGGIPELQWDSIQRFSPTAVITVPSFLIKLIDYAEEKGIDYKNSSVKKAICIGEALRKPDFSYTTLANRIREKWDIDLYATYASTEMGTAFTECSTGQGGHHHPELIIVEFLDDKDQQVPVGEPGEVTITTLGVEGMPLIRFKTGDVCNHYTEPCSCGRTSMRLGPVIGRKNQMIKYKGTTLYPPSLYDILDTITEVQNYIVEVFTNDIGTDGILIKAGVDQHSTRLEKKIKDHFRAKLRVAPSIKFYTSKEIEKLQNPETSRKAVRFIDHRNAAKS